MAFNPRFVKRKDDHGYKINEHILANTVRIVGKDIESKECSRDEALSVARNSGMDLVEISNSENGVICKIIDFQKFLYEKKQKEKDMKKSSKPLPMKDIKLGQNIGDHDFEFKLRHAKNFLEKGHKVKAYIQFKKGREMAHKEAGEIVVLKFVTALEDEGKVEYLPKFEGNMLHVIISPKKK